MKNSFKIVLKYINTIELNKKLSFNILLILISNIILFFFQPILYMTLIFNEKIFKKILFILFKIQYLINPIYKIEHYNTNNNLKLLNNKYQCKNKQKIIIQNNLKNIFFSNFYSNYLYLFLKGKQKLTYDIANINIINLSGIDIKNCNKIIFCHTHSGDNLIETIIKTGLLLDKNKKQLIVERVLSKKQISFMNEISKILDYQNINFYNPFKNKKKDFLKKIRTSHIIHLFVDLPVYSSLDNFSTSYISIFGKKAIVNNSAAKIALFNNAICIPVFTNGNTIYLLSPCKPNNTIDKISSIDTCMEHIFKEIFKQIHMNPESWQLLHNFDKFFCNVKFDFDEGY